MVFYFLNNFYVCLSYCHTQRFLYCCLLPVLVWHWVWLKEMYWPLERTFLPSCLQTSPSLLRCWRVKVAAVLSSLQLGEQHVSVSVPYKHCYFSCHVCWGTAFGLFFLQKGRKANLENTAHMSSVITWPLCQALACWQLQEGEWVRPSCSQQEARGKEILICHGLHLPSLLLPSIFCSPWGATAITSHNKLSPFFTGLPVPGGCSFLSSFFHPLNGTSREIT